MTRFVIVHFTIENTVSAVPEGWISGDEECSWPNTTIVRPLIKQCALPKTTWNKFPAKIFRDHQGNIKYYDSLEVAEQKAEKAEGTSDLSTDEDDGDDNSATRNWKSHPMPEVSSFVLDQDMEVIIENDEMNGTLTPLIASTSKISVDESITRSKEECECRSGRLTIILEKLAEEVANLKSDIVEIKEMLRDQWATITDHVEVAIQLPNLPVNSLDEFLILEEFSKIPQQATALMKHLSTTGGTNVGNATRRVWSMMVTDHVSKGLSWIGAHQKVRLQGLNINRVVIVAVRKIVPAATELEILSATKVWVRKSAERLKKSL